MIAGIYRTTIIVLVPQGAATIKALIRFGIVKHAEQLLHARSQQIISAAILLNHENNIPRPGSGSAVVFGLNAGWQTTDSSRGLDSLIAAELVINTLP